MNAGYSTVHVNAEQLIRQYGRHQYTNISNSALTYSQIYVVGVKKVVNTTRYSYTSCRSRIVAFENIHP